MTKNNQYYPDRVSHPGIDLAEKLEEMGMGPKEFAIRTSKPEKTISAILNGTSSITPDMAVMFENVLKIPGHYWLNRQRNYDEYIAREKMRDLLSASVQWAKKFPVHDMAHWKWIEDWNTDEELVEVLLRFFEMANQEAWKKYFLQAALRSIFSLPLENFSNPHPLTAWLRQGEIKAEKRNSVTFSKTKFSDALEEVKKSMYKHSVVQIQELVDLCAHGGVKLIVTENLPRTKICAAARWIDDTPVIQLGTTFNNAGHFWHTLFHEAGHVMLHGKKEVFLEGISYSGIDITKENEAEKFSAKWTQNGLTSENLHGFNDFSEKSILKKAAELETHPCILIDKLKRRGKIEESLLQKYNTPFVLMS